MTPLARLATAAALAALAILAATALTTAAAQTTAQATAQPAAAIRFEDTIAQRTLACTACHGQQGRAGPDGYYPRLAGKPAGYLYNQLLNFREGRRHYGLMTSMVDPLGDAYLMEIAQYFASLDVPYGGRASGDTPQLTREAMQRGEQLALRGDASRQLPACVQCHGAALTGVQPATPGLLGLPRDYLNAQLGAWRTATRRAHAPDCMATIANRLAPDDIAAVTGWLALQQVPAQAKAVASLPAALPMECGSAPAPRPAAAGARP